MKQTLITRLFGLCALALCAIATVPVQALTSYQLRDFGIESLIANSASSIAGEDIFTNGDPYTGMFFAAPPGGMAHTGGYLSGGFSAGAELSGPASDFAGQHFGVGSLAFRYQDAILSTTNLTPAGREQRSLTLQTTAVPGTVLGLVNRNNGFETWAVWDFVRPDPGSAIQLTLVGTSTGTGSTGTSNYTDRLRVRLLTDHQSGETFVAFEKVARTDGILTLTTLEQHSLSELGLDLSAVDHVALQLSRARPTAGDPNPTVHAQVAFLDDVLVPAGDDLVVLGQLDFQASATSFDNAQFSSLFTAAAWLAPVSEPGSLAMLLAGLAVIGGLLRRRVPR